jgi:hypothetical protein
VDTQTPDVYEAGATVPNGTSDYGTFLIGSIAHELGHYFDSLTNPSFGSSTLSTAAFVANRLASEGEAEENSLVVQQEVANNSGGQYITAFLLTPDASLNESFERAFASGSLSGNALVAQLAAATAVDAVPSTDGSVPNYLNYYDQQSATLFAGADSFSGGITAFSIQLGPDGHPTGMSAVIPQGPLSLNPNAGTSISYSIAADGTSTATVATNGTTLTSDGGGVFILPNATLTISGSNNTIVDTANSVDSAVTLSGTNNSIQLVNGASIINSGTGNSAVLSGGLTISLDAATTVTADPVGDLILKYGADFPNGSPAPTATFSARGSGSGQLSVTRNGSTVTEAFNTAAQEYGEVGATFGSSLGRILAGNNAFGQIGASTVLGTLGQEVGGLIAAETTPGLDVEKAIDGLVSGNEILSSVEGQGVGAISAYLIGDLFKDIGLTGAPAQIVQSLAGQTVAQIATNLIDQAAGEINPATGVVYTWSDGINLGANLENIAGGFVGTELGNLVFSASTVQGEDGEAVGSAVGGEIGTLIAPGIGTAIGSFVGDIVGGLIGDLFGQSHVSHIGGVSFTLPSAGGSLTFSYSPWANEGGPDATGIGDAITGSLNAVLGEVGGALADAASLTPFGIGVNDETTTSGAGPILYYYDDYTTGIRTQYDASSTTLTQVLDYAETRELSEMAFSGGDPYVELAIDAGLRSASAPDGPVFPSTVQFAPQMVTVSGDIQIAEDYETYEANKTVINALIEANPTSDFAAGWIAELAIAASMGLGTSVQGGTDNDTLGVTGDDKILIGGGGDDTYIVNPGDGNVTIDNGVSYNNAANGILDLNTPGLYYDAPTAQYGLTPGATNLTFTVSGADLVVGDGQGDNVTLKGWFAGSFAELNQINLANGTIVGLYYIQLAVGQETQNEFIIGGSAGYYYGTTATSIGIEGFNAFTNNSNAIAGGDGEDVLAGGTGANTFITGGGADIAYGGGGADTYQLDATGQLTIYNNQTETGTVVGSSASGSLAFGAASGVAFNDLSFAQTGNDLTISVAGSSSQVTVAGWFANAYSQLQTITTTYDGVEITYYGSGLFASQHIGLGGGAFATETWQIGQAWTYYTSYYNAAGGLTEADFFTAPNQFLEKEVINPDGSYAWSYFGSSNNVVETDYYTSGNQRYQIDVNSANANVSASGIAVSVAAGVQGTIVTGTADTITAGSGSSVTVITNSGTDTINLTANSGSTVTLGTNSNAVINGAGNTINLSGPGNTLDAGGETVNVAANSLAVFNGSNNAIYAGSGDTIEITSGAGNVIYANGDTITLSAGVSATINGTANTVDSNNGTVTTIYDNGGGNTVNLAANSGATVIVSTDSNATVTGAGNTVDLSGPANTLDASGETVNLAANSLAVFYGDSNAIYAAGDDMIEINGGNNNIIYDAGNTVTLAAGLAATIVGNSNVLTMGSGDTVAVVNGAGEIINNDVAGNSVNLYSGASATVNGSGGYIGIVGTGISVTASYETINTIPSASFTIYGLGNTITLGSGSGVSVNDGGSDNTITLTANSGSTVIVGANSNAVVNGSGNSVELSGPANTLDASGETVSLVANALAVFYGSNNAIYAASGDTIEINTGTGNIINAAGGSNETVTLAGASDETVWFVQSGNDLRIDFMGTQNEVTIAGWFASTANKVQEVTAGGLKLDSQLSSLVAAMATYTAAHPGFDPTAVAQAPNDNALQTAIAAAWHS